MGLVYHYTSLDAALKILQGKKLRFTDCEYLDDEAEIVYCYKIDNDAWYLELCRREVPEACASGCVTNFSHLYDDEIDLDGQQPLPARLYVFCTTDSPDDCLMWREYACHGGRAGCALAFDADVFKRELHGGLPGPGYVAYHEVLSGEVAYGRKSILPTLQSAISTYLDGMDSAAVIQDDIARLFETEGIRGNHWDAIARLAPFMKRTRYQSERERRFVLRVPEIPQYESGVFSCPTYPVSKLCFRPGDQRRGLIPYREWDFSSCTHEMVRAVIFPPETPAHDRSVRSMRRFLRQNGYEATEVLVAGDDALAGLGSR